MTHPDELLAEYVDGALHPRERARVEAHLDACGVCPGAGPAPTRPRQTLRALPELEEPPGTTMAVLREARRARTPSRWAAPLRVAAIVVLIAGALGAGLYVVGQVGEGGEDAAPAADGAGEPAPQAEEGEAAAEDEARAAAPSARYPLIRRTGTEHDPDSIVALAADLRDEATAALEEGFPADAFAFYDAFPVDAFPPAGREALVCAGQGLDPERSAVPFVIEDAAWEGKPAWVVSYLQGSEPDASYERVQILVVQRETCALLHFAEQRL